MPVSSTFGILSVCVPPRVMPVWLRGVLLLVDGWSAPRLIAGRLFVSPRPSPVAHRDVLRAVRPCRRSARDASVARRCPRPGCGARAARPCLRPDPPVPVARRCPRPGPTRPARADPPRLRDRPGSSTSRPRFSSATSSVGLDRRRVEQLRLDGRSKRGEVGAAQRLVEYEVDARTVGTGVRVLVEIDVGRPLIRGPRRGSPGRSAAASRTTPCRRWSPLSPRPGRTSAPRGQSACP